MTFENRNRVIDAIIELVAMKYFLILKFIWWAGKGWRGGMSLKREEFKVTNQIIALGY